ncbi:hypothetical protein APASM_5048 [Actinosynnema pretiosum subsp. pretiosum]|nr:hypothetical protein APASM_5048 [Actinosynnema pretiosum subsp. pretiosum]
MVRSGGVGVAAGRVVGQPPITIQIPDEPEVPFDPANPG